MIKFIKLLKTRDAYFAEEALNTSFLKAFDHDPESVISPEEVSGKAIEYGSAVDTLLFDGPVVFNEKFYTMETPEPTATALLFAETYAAAIIVNGVKNRDTDFGQALCKSHGFWKTIKDITKLIPKFDTEDVWAFIQAKVDSVDKIIIDSDTYTRVLESVATLRDNKYTNKYFVASENTEVFDQLAIVFEYKGVRMKGMLDSVVVDHLRKAIVPTDTKTMAAPANMFFGNLTSYRYDLQAEIYTHAVAAWAKETYPGYRITPFRFIVISKFRTDKPYVFMLNPISWRKRINKNRMSAMNGLDEILEQYLWHKEQNSFFYPREMMEYGYITL